MAVLEVRDLHKSFERKAVHRGVSFSVRKGTCLGLIGGSGAGKSVILKSLIGLIKPDRGEVFVHGENITHFSERRLVDVRRRVAYVFQNGALFDSLTVFDNLAYPLREHTDLSEIEIADRIHNLLSEFGLEQNDQVYPADLSGGMQKRVGLARSIILGPEVVLYDEPTAGLDPFNTIKIQEMILRMKAKGVTSIFVTHDIPSALATCDEIALLLGGRIAEVKRRDAIDLEAQGLIQDFIHGRTD
jgi:phospholipid/cholesterol/gamma-HCH transport system ATP-binding protein